MASRQSWDDALLFGMRHGYRNAQASVLAPTGTIGLLMDCDTTGIVPDFALVKFKKLAGGGYFKIINGSIPPALARLGYSEAEAGEIVRYCLGHGTLDGAPGVSSEKLRARGFTEAALAKVDSSLAGAFSLAFSLAFTRSRQERSHNGERTHMRDEGRRIFGVFVHVNLLGPVFVRSTRSDYDERIIHKLYFGSN